MRAGTADARAEVLVRARAAGAAAGTGPGLLSIAPGCHRLQVLSDCQKFQQPKNLPLENVGTRLPAFAGACRVSEVSAPDLIFEKFEAD